MKLKPNEMLLVIGALARAQINIESSIQAYVNDPESQRGIEYLRATQEKYQKLSEKLEQAYDK